ncbi:cytochrome P450 [Peterkaempfera bronchialis]|uniref:Cytochrome P450 n=1 Tax=Peterkaempfera bronchialis TaxID=2126346 RepID=A0A345T395_9ACTN|nr:cytochrome P450 [Peterkaempfera bronchialis]
MAQQPTCPFRLDPAGSDFAGESARLRALGPATRVELPDAVEAWSITGVDLLKELLNDPRVSKDPNRHWPAYINGEISQEWPLFLWIAVTNMFTAYGEDHMRLRKLVAKAFTPRRTAAMRPRIEEITGDLLDAIAATPAGEPVDLRAALAHPLPIKVICDLFGVPDKARDELRRAVDSVFNAAAPPEEVAATQVTLYGLLADLVSSKRAAPGDDMTSDLISARSDDGSGLSEAELLDTLLLTISAGFETTVNLLDNAITALLTHPDQLALVRSGGATWDDVIDEALRWKAPVPNLPLRFAVEDIELEGGVTIRQGDAILAAYGAAGRDPQVHGETAEEFDITRPTRRDHLAFGYGAHYCLGVSLARLEAAIVLPALFERFPDLTLAVPADRLESLGTMLANGHKAVPALLRPMAAV